ncbi:mitochondrial import inner membrane translocase subunit TIM44-like, partial [Condylostylus longicornis]|uniref:mitochondrial import inner membrane translocase subunit TIM44-like n=1 Tax=Condylostylus longicornis TaxID=2530218 RepID=UPI00244E21D0
MIGKLLGESAQAAALREMKAIDPSFRLPELVELAEHVIAPHLVHSFLNGDREALKIQCGEAAYAAVDHSIKERDTLKLSLDPTVLLLRNVEFKGASTMPDKAPWFIFTFTAQQINCMRDKDDRVVVGAIDDIREVVYSVALMKHPDPEIAGLEYPWQ